MPDGGVWGRSTARKELDVTVEDEFLGGRVNGVGRGGRVTKKCESTLEDELGPGK